METRVYINGKYREKTVASRRQVIRLMRKLFGATLLRERLVMTSEDSRQYREMRFATQALLQPTKPIRSRILERR